MAILGPNLLCQMAWLANWTKFNFVLLKFTCFLFCFTPLFFVLVSNDSLVINDYAQPLLYSYEYYH